MTHHFSSFTLSLNLRKSVGVIASTERSSELTFTNSQIPGLGLIAKATYGGSATASCKFQVNNIKIHKAIYMSV